MKVWVPIGMEDDARELCPDAEIISAPWLVYPNWRVSVQYGTDDACAEVLP